MKKKVWILGGLLAVGLFSISLSLTLDQRGTYLKSANKSKTLKIKISGAVNNPGEFEVNFGEKLYSILKRAGPKHNANLSKLDFDSKILKNSEIYIPYDLNKGAFLKWKELNNINQLTLYGITKSTAQKVLKLRKDNESITWQQLESLKGVGQATLKKLQNILII
ncbi:MAG0490 family ComEA-like DNA-binding protein [Mycoplasmopsis bovigenitalium]|uniref:MAG0490 family ComEA-like DNA-binding protein n=1 Tax=Mycoplasmopsis bovigenitalium TaxID=2112 RepID=UPI00101D812E|nr:hypothetical protein [Mycoplasmopsis bovigenitalium]